MIRYKIYLLKKYLQVAVRSMDNNSIGYMNTWTGRLIGLELYNNIILEYKYIQTKSMDAFIH